MASFGHAVFGLALGLGVAFGAVEARATVYCTAPGVPAGCVWNPGGVGVLPGAGAGAAGAGLTREPGVGVNGVGVYPGAGAGAAGSALRRALAWARRASGRLAMADTMAAAREPRGRAVRSPPGSHFVQGPLSPVACSALSTTLPRVQCAGSDHRVRPAGFWRMSL